MVIGVLIFLPILTSLMQVRFNKIYYIFCMISFYSELIFCFNVGFLLPSVMLLIKELFCWICAIRSYLAAGYNATSGRESSFWCISISFSNWASSIMYSMGFYPEIELFDISWPSLYSLNFQICSHIHLRNFMLVWQMGLSWIERNASRQWVLWRYLLSSHSKNVGNYLTSLSKFWGLESITQLA